MSFKMKTRNIIKKQLSTLPCRFILGCIGHTNQLSPDINPKFLDSIEKRFGIIEEILPIEYFSNAPINYIHEMDDASLSTTMIILKQAGSYTDLHHIKKDANKLEKEFLMPSGGRFFNVNPGAVGTYGLCLASHKPTGGRPNISTYAYGSTPHLFFGGDSFYERVSNWTGSEMKLVDYIRTENKFSEYHGVNRMKAFDNLVRTLKKNEIPVELL